MQLSDQVNIVIAAATCLSVIGSLMVAVLTMHIAKSNRLTADLMKAQIEAATRPYVSMGPTVRIGTPLLQLVIENLGQSSALDLRLELQEDFYFNAERQEARNLKRYTAFVHPISSFSPRSRLVFDLGTGPSIFTNPDTCPHRFTVKATYRHANQEYVESTTVDLQPFQLTTVPHDPVADEVEKVSKEIAKLTQALSKKAA